MEEKIKNLLARIGPAELSALWHEIDVERPTDVITTAFDMSRRNEIWWLDVHGDHAIVGLPNQERPSDPLAYLGLTELESERGSILAPTDLIQKYGLRATRCLAAALRRSE